MAGKRQKPVAALQGHRAKPQPLVVHPASRGVATIPTAPKGLHPVAKKAWRLFWSSSLPQILDLQADDEAIRRWAYCLSEREKLEDQLRAEPLVLGSMGQSVRNPLFAVLGERTREVEKFREQFGMTPLHRMRLGITWDQADEARDRMERRRTAPVEPSVVEVGFVDDVTGDGHEIEVGA